MRPSLAHGGWLGLSLIVVNCAPGTDLPDVTVEGLHVRIAADSGLSLCAGSRSHMDEFVARAAAQFGLPPPTGEDRLMFYWLKGEDFYDRSHCRATALGCEEDGIIFSKEAPLDHELVHAIAHKLGHPPPFFTEGFAAAYSGLGAIRKAPTISMYGVRESVFARDYLSVDYGAAAAFNAFLVASHGIEAYLKAYALLPREPRATVVDDVFRDVFGASLAQLMDEFGATELPCSRAENDAKLVECAATEIAWDGLALEEFRQLSCEQADALGPYSGHELVVLKTLIVPQNGLFEITVTQDTTDATGTTAGIEELPSAISLVPCGACGAGPSVAVSAADGTAVVTLAAGRHSLRFHGSSKLTTNVGLRIARIALPGVDPRARVTSELGSFATALSTHRVAERQVCRSPRPLATTSQYSQPSLRNFATDLRVRPHVGQTSQGVRD